MYLSFNFIIAVAVFVAFTIGLNLGLHGIISLDGRRMESFPQDVMRRTGNEFISASLGTEATMLQKPKTNETAVIERRWVPEQPIILIPSEHTFADAHAATKHEDNVEPQTMGAANSRDKSVAASVLPSNNLHEKLERIDLKVVEFARTHSLQRAYNGYFDANIAYKNLPILLLTCNRPFLLQETIDSLLRVRGVRKSQIIVIQDGSMGQVAEIVRKNGLQLVQHTAGLRLRGGAGFDGASRIAQHYRFSLSIVFDRFPNAPALIVVEDDLLFSPDFYDYFTATAPLIEADPSIFIISAWSDNGFKNKVLDPHALRRTNYFPGLGWLLTRRLYKEELEEHWPNTHWDHWLRSTEVSKHRDIVYPQVPRTYHNGIKGTFMNLETHNKYFRDIGYNQDPAITWENNTSNAAIRGLYNYRIEQLAAQCKHATTVQEILRVRHEIVCVWVDVDPSCETANVPFKRIASFFGLWHEHRRGNYNGLHEFYFNDYSVYILLFNLHDEIRKNSADNRNFKRLMPSSARFLPEQQFEDSLLQDMKRKQQGVNVYKASKPGMSCDEVS